MAAGLDSDQRGGVMFPPQRCFPPLTPHLFQVGKLRERCIFRGPSTAAPQVWGCSFVLLPKTHFLGKEAIAVAGRGVPPIPLPGSFPPSG